MWRWWKRTDLKRVDWKKIKRHNIVLKRIERAILSSLSHLGIFEGVLHLPIGCMGIIEMPSQKNLMPGIYESPSSPT